MPDFHNPSTRKLQDDLVGMTPNSTSCRSQQLNEALIDRIPKHCAYYRLPGDATQPRRPVTGAPKREQTNAEELHTTNDNERFSLNKADSDEVIINRRLEIALPKHPRIRKNFAIPRPRSRASHVLEIRHTQTEWLYQEKVRDGIHVTRRRGPLMQQPCQVRELQNSSVYTQRIRYRDRAARKDRYRRCAAMQSSSTLQTAANLLAKFSKRVLISLNKVSTDNSSQSLQAKGAKST